MDVREKLVELIAETIELYPSEREELADGLIAHGVTVQEWIPVTEMLPEPFISVLVHMPGEEPFPTVHEGFISNDGIWQSAMFRREPGEVTYWQPMPQPPKGE